MPAERFDNLNDLIPLVCEACPWEGYARDAVCRVDDLVRCPWCGAAVLLELPAPDVAVEVPR